MAGVYFAFSAFIMAALERTGPAAGAAAMRAINRVILGSAFMPLFFGTTLAALAVAGFGLARLGSIPIGLTDLDAPQGALMTLGGVLYVVGMFVCTAARNVPLNNALDAAAPGSAAEAAIWRRYLRAWTAWNHVRAVASAAAAALFMLALTL